MIPASRPSIFWATDFWATDLADGLADSFADGSLVAAFFRRARSFHLRECSPAQERVRRPHVSNRLVGWQSVLLPKHYVGTSRESLNGDSVFTGRGLSQNQRSAVAGRGRGGPSPERGQAPAELWLSGQLAQRAIEEESMDTWKEFEQNTVTHSAAHHLVTISELLEEYGYARVSDVARKLEITRGSASVTLKGLKQRKLVTEDERRFLGLSDEGQRIASGIRAKKRVMATLFMDLLAVSDSQADIDTCKIEHLISNETADRASRLLAFLQSSDKTVKPFLNALRGFDGWNHDPAHFPPDEVKSLKLHEPDTDEE